MKKGFSLAELMIVVVIMGILGALAIPQFTKSAEKGRANQAVTYLRLIHTAEKVYFANNGAYWPSEAGQCAAATCTQAEIQSAVNGLGVDLSGSNYAFSLTGGGAGGFTAQADGDGNSITINTAGTISGNPFA